MEWGKPLYYSGGLSFLVHWVKDVSAGHDCGMIIYQVPVLVFAGSHQNVKLLCVDMLRWLLLQFCSTR